MLTPDALPRALMPARTYVRRAKDDARARHVWLLQQQTLNHEARNGSCVPNSVAVSKTEARNGSCIPDSVAVPKASRTRKIVPRAD